MMGGEVSDYRIITCHLGNGSSVAAVKYGKSIDTSMGYTPLDGLVMGTRSGEIDPAIIPFLIVKENMDAEQIDEYLNRRSGVLGISGLSSDFRDLESAAHRGDERSQLAIDVFAYRVKIYRRLYGGDGRRGRHCVYGGFGREFFFHARENLRRAGVSRYRHRPSEKQGARQKPGN